MDIIVPVVITGDEFENNNVDLDEGLLQWSADDDYVVENEVISLSTNQVYRALKPSGSEAGIIQNPDEEWERIDNPLDIENTAPIYWDRLYPTNPYRLFDQSPTNATTNPDTIDVTLNTGTFVQGLAFFGVSADEIVVTIRDAGEVVYESTTNMADNTAVKDWWTYYFQPIRETEQLVITDLPPYGDAKIQIQIKRENGIAECGEIVAGSLYNLGRTKTEPRIKMLDYSKIEEDQYGNLTTAVRGATQVVTYEVWLPGLNTENVFNQIKALRGAQKVVWIGDAESRLSLINYGYVSSLEMRVAASNPVYTTYIDEDGVEHEVLAEKGNTYATIETKGIL